MANETLALFHEIKPQIDGLAKVHPLKLDRWHRGLIGLPDVIYMQLGCDDIIKQLALCTHALGQLIAVLGADNLPVKPQELSRRKIAQFTWYVPDEAQDATVECVALWVAEESTWKLSTSLTGDKWKLLPSFDEVVDGAVAWIRAEGVKGVEDPPHEQD
jgi:hypothetical protein